MLNSMLYLLASGIAGSALGGYGGYRFEIRGTPPAQRPTAGWQWKTVLIACLGGSILNAILTVLFAASFPSAGSLPAIIPLLLGFGVGVMLTQRWRRNNPLE